MNLCIGCGESYTSRPSWSTFFWPEQISLLCRDCEHSFHKLKETGCPSCMKQTVSGICSDCLYWEKTSYQGVLEKNVSLYSYEPFMQDYIARWKYRGDYVLGKVFEAEFRKLYYQHFQDTKYEVVPIPLSAERMAERGFNQAGELAAFTQAKQKLVLGRKHGEKQSKRSRLHRLTADNPFNLLSEPPKYAVLIDDIYTTGTTLRHAAQVLQENGTEYVAACTLIRG